MDVQFVASIAPIVRDADAARSFYQEALGLNLEGHEGAYRFTHRLEGTKHFGLWPLSEAASACFGTTEWPADVPIPQASIEFEVADVAAAAAELRARGYRLIHDARTEPWSQVTARLLSPEGLLVAVCSTPAFHETRTRPDIADRFEIEALRGEVTDALMTRDYDRFASLFTEDGAWRIPYINVELVGRDDIRAGIERMQGLWDYFVQTTHPGTIRVDGDAAVGRAYVSEFGHMRNGRSELNYAVWHDRYERTPDGWKFAERVYEIRYVDPSPLAGTAPQAADAPAPPPAEHVSSGNGRR